MALILLYFNDKKKDGILALLRQRRAVVTRHLLSGLCYSLEIYELIYLKQLLISGWNHSERALVQQEESTVTRSTFLNVSVSLELKYVWAIGIGEELLGWEKYSCKEEKRGWGEMTVSLNTCINHTSDVSQSRKPQL